MTEFVLRAKFQDHRVVEEVLTDPTSVPPRLSSHIRRIVVDATAITGTDLFSQAAADTGTQLLVDPQTPLLTTEQPPDDSWARLPFAQPGPLDVQDLRTPPARAQLIEAVVEFQLDHGATAIIPPYLHLDEDSGFLAQLQSRLLLETGHYVRDDLQLGMDVLPLISIDRGAVSSDRTDWEAGAGRILRAATQASQGQPYALALSATTRPTTTSIHKSAQIWRRAARIGTFLAWHEGSLGLLAITLGAAGYEAGMCVDERCDVRQQQRNRRPGNGGNGPRYKGAYVDALHRSLAMSAVRSLSTVRGAVQADLGCIDPTCCPRGFDTMLGSGRRQHAVRRRLSDLAELATIGSRIWRLHHLQVQAEHAAMSAARIRQAAQQHGIPVGAYPDEHQAASTVLLGLRATARAAIA